MSTVPKTRQGKSLAVGEIVVAFILSTYPFIVMAEIGDPTIRTDHAQYAGEGAFQTIEDCVRFATESQQHRQDQAIAMYLWLLTHQWHLASPQEFNVPGVQPDTRRANAIEMMVMDANRGRFSYGYGLCGTVHAWNEPYWKAMGMNARRRAFPGHTNSEIEFDGSWHAFDTDMAGLIFRRDGVVAGYKDVVKDAEGATQARPPVPCYPFAWPADYRVMQAGWQEVAKGGDWYSMYHSGYAAHPGIVHLRRGETFTRYFDRDHFGGPSKRRFWHHQPDGPFRDWTFANEGTPRHDGASSNSRGNASCCNGVFVYQPKLDSESAREGMIATSTNVALQQAKPHMRSADGQPAFAVFSHFSPFVICGDPTDDANPMTGHATDGLKIDGKAIGVVKMSVSPDEGQTWLSSADLAGNFQLDLTDVVKGRYGWRAKFEWMAGSGLEELKFTTTTQVSQAIYPRLKPGGSIVTYRAASRAVVPLLPNWSLPESEIRHEYKPLRSSNVRYTPRSSGVRYAYRTTNNQPGVVVFRIDSPTELVEVSAAVRFGVSVPPPPDCKFFLGYSLDSGQTWNPLAEAIIPPDNQYSSGWMFGCRTLETKGLKSALVRAHFYNGGREAGLIDAQLYGLRKTAPPQAAKLTFGWQEKGEQRTFHQDVPANTESLQFTVPTGMAIEKEFLELSSAD